MVVVMVIGGGGGGGGGVLVGRDVNSESFLLSFSSLMVLEPVENILTFNLTILSKSSRNPLDLLSIWRAKSIDIVKVS